MPNNSSAIPLRVTFLTTVYEKSWGLIGKNPVYPISFTTRCGIHTFGMKVPIDVLILDNDHRVVYLTRNLQPNHFFFWNPKYYTVVELPSNWITEKKILAGDRCVLK